MAITELDPGQSHTIAEPVALRVVLVGGEGIAELQALDRAGDETMPRPTRLTPTEMILTPQPRRVRLVVVPTSGGSFPPQSSIGLAVRTEGRSLSRDEVIVAQVDLGALSSHDLAVVEFAGNRVIVSVPAIMVEREPIDLGEPTDRTDPVTPPVPANEPVEVWSPGEEEWLQPGRYALRQARQLAGRGTVGAPPLGWALVVDGSVSMGGLVAGGILDSVLRLVCGSLVEWTQRWATDVKAAGIHPVSASASRPGPFADSLLESVPPSSWAAIGQATAQAASRLGGAGTLVVVADGTPGDVAALTDVARRHPRIRFVVVAVGVSAAHALGPDQGLAWWQEELGGLSDFAGLPNTGVVAIRPAAAGRLDLDDAREAEVALRLAQSIGAG